MSIKNPIHVKNLNFQYPGSEKILKNVNFELPPGSRCLLAGGNGTGKSTFLQVTNPNQFQQIN